MTSAKQSPTPHPSRTVPIPDTLESIKGYPDKHKIYRMAASSFWQVRFFDGKSTITRSTGQTDKREAIKSAISFYEKLLINKHNGVAIVKNTCFDACASSFMQAQAARVMRKEMTAECHRNDQYFLDGKVPAKWVINSMARFLAACRLLAMNARIRLSSFSVSVFACAISKTKGLNASKDATFCFRNQRKISNKEIPLFSSD
jgi:hypothetical protein